MYMIDGIESPEVGAMHDGPSPEMIAKSSGRLHWCLDVLGENVTRYAVCPEYSRDQLVVEQWAREDAVPETAIPKVDILFGAARIISRIRDGAAAKEFFDIEDPQANGCLDAIAWEEPYEAARIVDAAVNDFLGQRSARLTVVQPV